MGDVFEKKAVVDIPPPCVLCREDRIGASGISGMCKQCYFRETLTGVILTKGSKKLKLGPDGLFHEIEDCETIIEMHERLKDEGEEVEEQ